MKNARDRSFKGGFSFVEFVVVLAIIAVLTSIVSIASQKIFARQKIAEAKTSLNQLNTTFEIYFAEKKDYPPYGIDLCSSCNSPPNSSWISVVDAIQPYMTGRIEKDPWGRYWAYDKNYTQPCWGAYSMLCSAGPNGSVETNSSQSTGATASGDDICIFIEDYD